MDTIGRVWLAGVVGMGATTLIVMDRATYVSLPIAPVSLNLLGTAMYVTWVGAGLVLFGSRYALAIVGGAFGLGLMSASLSGIDLHNAQYLLTVAAFVLGASVRFSTANSQLGQSVFWWAAIMNLGLFTVDLIPTLQWFGRASAPAAVISILVAMSFADDGRRRPKWLALTLALTALTSLTLDTSRMATALSFICIAGWLLAFSGWRMSARLLASGWLFALQVAYWRLDSYAYQRMWGHDASIAVGGFTVNGEGRREAASIATSIDTGTAQVLWGHGIGSSGQRLVDAGLVLDKPHNEFVRLYVDGGLLAIMLWILMLVAIVCVGIRVSQVRDGSAVRLLAPGLALVLLGFSVSDNPLSYSWVMIPSGVLLALLRGDFVKQLGHESAPD